MLDSLDTLIAFVLIMLVVSLLITIVVQMCAAALNLRSVNLLSGLGSVIAVIDPNLEEHKKELAQYLLRGRLLSDSFLPTVFSKQPQWLEKFAKWLDHQKRPELSNLLQFVPKWLNSLRATSAARPQEIFDAIRRVAVGNEYKDANNPAPTEQQLRNQAAQLLTALGLKVETLQDATKAAKDLADKIGNAVAAVSNDALKKEAQDALTQVSSKLNAFETATVRIGAQTVGDVDAAYEKFHYYACIAQERAQQWLTMHTRILTIIFAAVAAFVLQLDTVEIFKLVSTNKTVRDKLVAQAGAMQTEASRVLVDTPVLQEALKNWSDKETDPAIKTALSDIAKSVMAADTREAVQKRVSDALQGKNPSNNFNAAVSAAVKRRVDDESGELHALKDDLDKTGFALIPAQGLFTRWDESGDWSLVHILGVLFSAGLLSLGAPFWYSTLKNLVDLRSQVAQNISAEQKEAEKQPNKPKQPPPTVKPLTLTSSIPH
jgi:hypothetical protein